MAYKKGTYKGVQLRRFYTPRFWPGIVPEGEDQESLKPDYPYFFKKDEWSEDEIFGLFEPDNATSHDIALGACWIRFSIQTKIIGR
jgi:hypothetical protein